MTFEERFTSADGFLMHMDVMMEKIDDQLIQQRYIGFITVSAVTVYELAIKDIIFRFSDQKHKVLGSVSRSIFEKMNGRIALKDLKESHISRYGDKYVNRFNKILEQKDMCSLETQGESIKTAYGNVIAWRNQFAHNGVILNTTNYEEVKKYYGLGKEVIYSLDEALTM